MGLLLKAHNSKEATINRLMAVSKFEFSGAAIIAGDVRIREGKILIAGYFRKLINKPCLIYQFRNLRMASRHWKLK